MKEQGEGTLSSLWHDKLGGEESTAIALRWETLQVKVCRGRRGSSILDLLIRVDSRAIFSIKN